MKTHLKVAILAVCSALVGLPTSEAADTWPVSSEWARSDVNIQFGNAKDEFVVAPGKLTLRAGNLYRIVIANPSQLTHIVSVPYLAGRVLTTDVRRYSGDRAVAPDPTNFAGILYGKVALGSSSLTPLPGEAFAMQLAPMQTAEWYLKPTMEGTFKIRCAMPEHALAGMEATLEVM